jgi:hypothetical protein
VCVENHGLTHTCTAPRGREGPTHHNKLRRQGRFHAAARPRTSSPHQIHTREQPHLHCLHGAPVHTGVRQHVHARKVLLVGHGVHVRALHAGVERAGHLQRARARTTRAHTCTHMSLAATKGRHRAERAAQGGTPRTTRTWAVARREAQRAGQAASAGGPARGHTHLRGDHRLALQGGEVAQPVVPPHLRPLLTQHVTHNKGRRFVNGCPCAGNPAEAGNPRGALQAIQPTSPAECPPPSLAACTHGAPVQEAHLRKHRVGQGSGKQPAQAREK